MTSRVLVSLNRCFRSFTKCQQVPADSYATRSISTQLYALNAGHSKWANIKHIKAAKDGQKAALFTRITRQIRLAIQDGGSADPAMNSQLKSIIEGAVRQNMPMATIQNTLKKFTASKVQLKKYRIDVRYKQKVFVVCSIFTDNLAQLKMDMATVLRKGGGVLLDASHLFEDFGLIQAIVPKERLNNPSEMENVVTEDALETGAEDVEIIDAQSGSVHFICKPEVINGVRKLLEDRGYLVDNTEHIFTPQNTIKLTPEELVDYEKFVDKLKSLAGIEEVYDNVEVAE